MYNLLKSGFVQEGVLRLEEDAVFPVAQAEVGKGHKDKNRVLARSSVLDLLDIFTFVAEGGSIGTSRLGYYGVIITGPPGDGKVLNLDFLSSQSA
jgi:hypothetical protein